MQKRDVVQAIAHNINVEPLKDCIRDMFDPTFKGRKQDLIDYIKNKTADELAKIIYSQSRYFQLDIHCLSLSELDKSFTKAEVVTALKDKARISKLMETMGVDRHEIYADVLKLHFFIKVAITGFKLNFDSGDSLGGKSTIHVYVPAFIEFMPPTYVKFSLGKLAIKNGDYKHTDGTTRLHITQIIYSPEHIVAVYQNEVIEKLLNLKFKTLDLTNGVKSFVTSKKFSALELAWDKENGIENQTNGKKDQKLYDFESVNEKIVTALGLGPMKWYITDPRTPAEAQDFRSLNSIRISPNDGNIKVDKYQADDTLEAMINSLIVESNG